MTISCQTWFSCQLFSVLSLSLSSSSQVQVLKNFQGLSRLSVSALCAGGKCWGSYDAKIVCGWYSDNSVFLAVLSEYQPYTSYVIATPALTPSQSADTDSLLSPRKYLENFRGLEFPRTRTRTCSSRTRTKTRT